MAEKTVRPLKVRLATESDVPELLALMRGLAEAVRRGCGLIKWQVARWNTDAARFHKRLGAAPDPEWVDYSLSSEAFAALARN